MKKILALVLAVLMIAGSVVAVSADFTDVAADSIYAEAINDLQTKKVIAGKTETTFGPDELVTRWQMALFMARAATGDTDDANWNTGSATIFTDCTQYLGAIQYCYSMGIINGVSADRFAPDANITLRDGVIMAIRALGYEKEDLGLADGAKRYNVVGANYWVPYYQRAAELGMLEKLDRLPVDKQLTRAETAQLIYNMLYTAVYSTTGNDNHYTMNDIVFEGKKVIEVNNTKKAWIAETPKYFFNDDNRIGIDEEYVLVGYETDESYFEGDSHTEWFEMSFDELEKYGVDTSKIDDYFGATFEIVNYKETDKIWDKNDYTKYEYLMNFEMATVKEFTDADFTFNDDEERVRVDNKTHYDSDLNKANTLKFFLLDVASDDIDDIEFNVVNFEDIDELFFDARLYDVDNDGYYEYGFVMPCNIDVYVEPAAKGTEKFGDIVFGLEEVIYSEELVEDEIVVYTYDAFANTVNVKAVLDKLEGKVTAYSQKKTYDDDDNEIVTGYVTIAGTKYTIEDVDVQDYFQNGDHADLDDVDLVDAAALRAQAKDFMSKTVEYYLFNETLIAFGEEVDEDKVIDYAIVKDFTDFELYDHVVMTALIDGVEEDIKVNKIYELKTNADGDQVKKLKYNIAKLGYAKLSKALNNIFGIYSYTYDEDTGYYALTIRNLEYNIYNFIDKTEAGTELQFSGGKAIDTINRYTQIRLSSNTKIYVVDFGDEDGDGQDVKIVKAKTTGTFSIPVTEATMFYADKIGFGGPECEGHNTPDEHGYEHGVASVLYISDSGNVFDIDDYTVAFVQETIEDVEFGTADTFGFEDEDEDEDFSMFTCDDNAFVLSTLAEVETIYLKGSENELPAGVYLIDKDGIIVDEVLLEDIVAGANVLTVENGEAAFLNIAIKASDINLYDFNDIRLDALGLTTDINTDSDSKAGVKTIKFMDFELDEVIDEHDADDETDDEFLGWEIAASVKKSNAKLIDYIEDEDTMFVVDYNDETETATFANDPTLNVIVLPNDATDRDQNGIYTNDWAGYPDNTICGVILNNVPGYIIPTLG